MSGKPEHLSLFHVMKSKVLALLKTHEKAPDDKIIKVPGIVYANDYIKYHEANGTYDGTMERLRGTYIHTSRKFPLKTLREKYLSKEEDISALAEIKSYGVDQDNHSVLADFKPYCPYLPATKSTNSHAANFSPIITSSIEHTIDPNFDIEETASSFEGLTVYTSKPTEGDESSCTTSTYDSSSLMSRTRDLAPSFDESHDAFDPHSLANIKYNPPNTGVIGTNLVTSTEE